MRSLIRLTLFIVARIGFVMSVVGWVVGPWRSVDYSMATMGSQFELVLHRNTWSISHSPASTASWRVRIQQVNNVPYNAFPITIRRPRSRIGWHLVGTGRPTVTGLPEEAWQCAGVSYASAAFVGSMKLSFDHWLVVTFFALFYGLLKWM